MPTIGEGGLIPPISGQSHRLRPAARYGTRGARRVGALLPINSVIKIKSGESGLAEIVVERIPRAAHRPDHARAPTADTFRATGITAYLEAGSTLENAQAMAAHESPRTTKLYDRAGDEITLDEVERITI
jgi:hypothetical protein